MKKLNIEKSTIVLRSNMNRKDLSLDAKKADPIKKNILKQLEIIHKSLDEVDSILNRMSIKNFFSDDYKNLVVQCEKKCSTQAKSAATLSDSFDRKYSDDQKEILIQNLDERISYLEERLAKMQ